MKINKRLMKTGPVYNVKGQNYQVVLKVVMKCMQGLVFTAEVVGGEHSGKYTTVEKKDLTIAKN